MTTLKKDVFLVRGGKNHAIYDLNSGKLYQIDTECLKAIEKIINTQNPTLTKKEEKVLKLLQTNNLITNTKEIIKEQDISTLKINTKPHFAWLEITQQCNLKCVFCYEESDCYKKNNMTMEDFEKAKQFLLNYGITDIQFIGGEPMIHPNLKEMILSCHGKFKTIEVYTNGTFITQEWCDFFKKYGIQVAISIHSFIPEEADKITQTKGAYKLIRRGIELVLKNKLNVRFATIQNKDIKIGKEFNDLKITTKTQPPRLIGRGSFNQFNYEMFKDVVITKDTFARPINKDFVIKAVSGHQCFNKDLYIAYNLEVFPCVMERRISHGFIKDANDLSVVKTGICKCNKDFINECKYCEFRYACHDCRPNCNGGNLYDKPWYCSYNPKTGRWKNIQKMFDRLSRQSNMR